MSCTPKYPSYQLERQYFRAGDLLFGGTISKTHPWRETGAFRVVDRGGHYLTARPVGSIELVLDSCWSKVKRFFRGLGWALAELQKAWE
jgi:hypothetical protein